MKLFLIKLLVFVFLSFLGLNIFLAIYGGYVDYFYNKFTTPKQYSMILGESRSMEGIVPSLIDSCMSGSEYKMPTYNYSFTIAQASYGPSYLEAVKRKLDTCSRHQLFIVTVNPWLLAKRDKSSQKDSDSGFADMPPHNMQNVTQNPNFEYLVDNFNYFHFRAVFKKNSLLYKDGHLENTNNPTDSSMFAAWKENQMRIYENFETIWEPSEYRIYWLNETVKYLLRFGAVYFVRMPIDYEVLAIENRFWPRFNVDIDSIATLNNIGYINFTSNILFETYDGNHLDHNGARRFTVALCDSILSDSLLSVFNN